jgi:hypothetical protein
MRGTLSAVVWRLTMAGSLIGVLTMCAAVGRVEGHAVGGLNTVTLSPTHGRASVAFVATYAISPCSGAAGLTIGFSWNALPPGGQVLGTALTDANCRATLSTTPPANAAPASYQVFAYVALPTGSATPNTEASASYTVDVTPTPTPKPTPKPTAHASATATSGASGSATAAASTPAPAGDAAGSSPTSNAGSSPAGRPAAATANRVLGQRGWWTLSWLAVGGTVLLALIFVPLLALLAGWFLRRRRARAASALRKDRAA